MLTNLWWNGPLVSRMWHWVKNSVQLSVHLAQYWSDFCTPVCLVEVCAPRDRFTQQGTYGEINTDWIGVTGLWLLHNWDDVGVRELCTLKLCEINISWWRHEMGTFSVLLALCAGNSPVNSPHKGHWRGALIFSFICAWINGWINNREAGDLRHHPAHYELGIYLSVILVIYNPLKLSYLGPIYCVSYSLIKTSLIREIETTSMEYGRAKY